MILLEHYQILKRGGAYYAATEEIPRCPTCGGSMRIRDSRKRSLITADGEVLTFRLRRLRCDKCNILHLELPDIFLPYKHYSREVIDMAVEGKLPYCAAENTTIHRWSCERQRQEQTNEADETNSAAAAGRAKKTGDAR